MKRLVILALLGVAGWYGWHHRDTLQDLLHRRPRNEAVVRNHSGETVTRIRLTVGGQTFVKEELASDASAAFPFAVDSDSPFDLVWEYAAKMNTGHWNGGTVAPGPAVTRYKLTIQPDGGVVYETEPIASGATSP